ncbi:MAG: hypothetical protein K6E95_03560 [Lachnospiraceae bacterium]|nr:hypothetical protein [Lachnospiraceae bacterium]
MAWCPKCKTEYQEGIEKCADCGSDLVEELPSEEEIPEETENVENDGEQVIGEASSEGAEGEELSEEEIEELKKELKRSSEPAKVYVSKKDESKDMIQTAYTFLVFAIILIVLFVLGTLDVISLFSSIPSIIVLAAMSIGCVLVGINAAFRARRAQAKVGEEEKAKDEIRKWLEENIVKEELEEKFASVEVEEERYLKEIDYVKDELMKEIENPDEALVDTMVEAFFDEHMNQ